MKRPRDWKNAGV